MRRILSLFVLAAVLPAAAQVKLPPYTRQLLPNGVVLMLMPRRDVPLVTLRILVRGGGESDPAEMAGLASITAELLRRGTLTRPADRFAEELESLGASFQATADRQATQVAGEFLSKAAAPAIALMADAVLKPAFTEAETKKALAQRIDASRALKDNALAAAGHYFHAFFFAPSHPYARPVEGDEISLARIDRAAIAGYHQRRYTGGNFIVIAAGDFEAAGMGAKLAAIFGVAPRGEACAWRKDEPPARGARPRLLLVDKPDLTQTYFYIGQPGIPHSHPDRIVLWLVNTLFGGRFTSMLNDELRVNSGLTYGARSVLERDRMTGAIAVSSYTRTESTAKAIDLAVEVQRRLVEKGLDAAQLASAKAYLKGTFPSERLETSDQLAHVLGEIELHDLTRTEVDDLFDRIDAVTLEAANAAARKYYRAENLVFVLVGAAAKIREAARKYASDLVETPITAPGFRPPR